jgi:thiosulfate/3-mercaptopyruvate sulfurtransferase
MHASPQGVDGHRYEGEQQPSCKSCHPDVGSNTDTVPQHVLHGDKLSCQVCHSVTYTSCDNCHVSISEKTGNPIFKTEATYLTFLIGLNPRQSEDRLYEYVPLRHVPVDIDSFSYYGEDLLTNFDLLSTWAYATPHNIQRNTPQNASCNSCHGNPAIFLTADKVKPEELEANQPVIVPEIPAAIPGQ